MFPWSPEGDVVEPVPVTVVGSFPVALRPDGLGPGKAVDIGVDAEGSKLDDGAEPIAGPGGSMFSEGPDPVPAVLPDNLGRGVRGGRLVGAAAAEPNVVGDPEAAGPTVPGPGIPPVPAAAQALRATATSPPSNPHFIRLCVKVLSFLRARGSGRRVVDSHAVGLRHDHGSRRVGSPAIRYQKEAAGRSHQ